MGLISRVSSRTYRQKNMLRLRAIGKFPILRTLATSPFSLQVPPLTFYQLIGITEDHKKVTREQIIDGYSESLETLSQKMGGSADADIEKLMDEMYLIDKAYKTLKDPVLRRDYDKKLEEGRLGELDDGDSHYQDLYSDKGFQNFKKTRQEQKMKTAIASQIPGERNFWPNESKPAGEKLIDHAADIGSSGWFEDPKNKKYIGYLWGSMLGLGVVIYGLSRL